VKSDEANAMREDKNVGSFDTLFEDSNLLRMTIVSCFNRKEEKDN
jgi:hypothetical protein